MAQTTVRVADEAPISETVVEAVSAATGDDPTELPPLYRTIDLEQLDRLFPEGTDPRGRVSFEVADCRVQVESDGRIVVEQTADVEEPPLAED